MSGPFEIDIIKELEQILRSRTVQHNYKREFLHTDTKTVLHMCCVKIMVSSGQYLSKNQLSGKIYTVFQFVCCGNPVSFFFYQNFYGIFQILAGKKSQNIIYLYPVKTCRKID